MSNNNITDAPTTFIPGSPVMPQRLNGHMDVYTPPQLSSAALKSTIFSAQNKTFKKEVINFFGVQIEIRQSSIRNIIDQASEPDNAFEEKRHVTIEVLLNNTFVPGTDDRVFEEADVDSLMSLPFGEDFSRVVDVYNRLSGVKVAEEKKS